MSSTFAGAFGPEMEADFHRLCLRRNPLFVIAYTLMGTVMLSLALFPDRTIMLLYGTASQTPVQITVWERLGLLVATVLFFVSAFALYRLWWLWWWPKVEREFGRTFSGEATEEGLRWGEPGELIPWRTFLAAKLS